MSSQEIETVEQFIKKGNTKKTTNKKVKKEVESKPIEKKSKSTKLGVKKTLKKEQDPIELKIRTILEESFGNKKKEKKPKRALSSWNIYVKDNYKVYKSKHPDLTMSQITKLLSQERKKAIKQE